MKILRRILLAVLAILILLFIVTYIIGRSYQHKEEVAVLVDAPIDIVFNEYTDENNMAKWMNSESMKFKESTLKSGKENTVGSTYELTFYSKTAGKDFSMIETITDFKPNNRIKFNLVDDFFNFDMDVAFKAVGDKTQITEFSQGQSNKFFMNAMLKFMASKTHKEKVQMYDQFKAMVENKYPR